MKVSQATAYALHAVMYMVRHITQLPVTTGTIAKAEGIPVGYLAKIFRRLVKAGIVKSVRGRKRGYVFARTPQGISLLELFEVVEGGPLFDDCLLRHCDCGGTPGNCCIYAHWISATREISKLLEETSVVNATWDHPDHRFQPLSDSLQVQKKKVNGKDAGSKIEVI